MPKIGRAHKNDLTSEIERKCISWRYFMALIFQQVNMICIGRLMLEGINSCPPT